MMMKKRRTIFIIMVLLLSVILSACKADNSATALTESKINVVATTTMLADLVENIGGEHVIVRGLMGPGIDPHLYQASAGDVRLLQKADVIVYNGLHLEGKMADIFKTLSSGDTDKPYITSVEAAMSEDRLLTWEDELTAYDPHVWFDIDLWGDVAKSIAFHLSQVDPVNKEDYDKNLHSYLAKLEDLQEYALRRINEIPAPQRVLVTAHDAFQYFGRAFNFEVRGLQGISTATEAGTGDMSDLADFIAENKIKAIFVETSVPVKTIEALQAAVKARNFHVNIGGELYSDSLGDQASGHSTYIATFKSNIDTIVDALK